MRPLRRLLRLLLPQLALLQQLLLAPPLPGTLLFGRCGEVRKDARGQGGTESSFERCREFQELRVVKRAGGQEGVAERW